MKKQVLVLFLALSGVVPADENLSGKGHCPRPLYPFSALQRGESGIVIVRINFGSNGHARTVVLVKSSGSKILDDNTVRWILDHWSDSALANKSHIELVTYQLHP